MSTTKDLNAVLPAAIFELCSTLEKSGHRAWLVGGAVRELLRSNAKVEIADFDFATSATPTEVSNIFEKVIPTGIEHGTVTVRLQGMSLEVTTLRGEEGYSDGRHPDRIYFTEDLTEDLARRDFTFNAIAYDPLTKTLTDPFEGQQDLEAKLIKAVGDAPKRFEEDGLRIMRCARFAAKLEFKVEEKTRRALQPAIPSYQKVAKERIIDEWWKALKTNRPSLCFTLLHEEKVLLATSDAFSEAVVSNETWREFDKLEATQPCLRLAFLLLELFVGNDDSKRLSAFLRSMKLSQKQQQTIAHAVHATHSLWQLTNSMTLAELSAYQLRAWIAQVGRLEVLDYQQLFAAYGRCHLNSEASKKIFLEKCRQITFQSESKCAYSLKELAFSGRDLMQLGVAKGPKIGTLLTEMLDATLLDPELNEHDKLKAWLENHLIH